MAETIRTDTSNAHGEITRLVIVHGPEDGIDSQGVILSIPPGDGGPDPASIGKEQTVLSEPPGAAGLSTPIKP